VTNPDATGNFTIVMTCMDSYEGKVNTTFTITVYNNPPYLVNGSIPTQYAQVNNNFVLDIASYYSDTDIAYGQTLTYTLTANTPNTWPNWLAFDSTTGYLFGVVPPGLTTTTYTFNLVVSDGDPSMAATAIITVIINQPVQMVKSFYSDYNSTNGKIYVTCSQLFTFNVTSYFTDADGDTLSYTITRFNGSSLPSWMGKSFTNVLSGMPGTDSGEILNMLVSVTDNKGYTLNVPLEFYVGCPPENFGRL